MPLATMAQRQLAGRLVDHLAVEHDRAAPVDRRGLLVGVQDAHRPRRSRPGGGVNASLTTATWVGCSTHLPS